MPTNPLDIVVFGQRRVNSTLAFPGRFDPPPGEVPDTYPGPDDQPYDRCGDPNQRDDWNADAASAAALKEFERLAAAQNETINDREWGAYLYKDASRTHSVVGQT